MKKILLQPPNALWTNNAFFEDEKHLLAAPWRELKRQLAELGYEMETADDRSLDDCAWIFFIDSSSIHSQNIKRSIKWRIRNALGMPAPKLWPYRDLYQEGIDHGMKDRMMFMTWESQVIDPYSYDPALWARFKHIFTWNEKLAAQKNFHFYLTSLAGVPPLEKTPSFSEKKLLVNISANKYSSHPNEFYGARRKTISYFSKHYPNDFDLFGTRWNLPQTRLQRMFPWLLVKKYSTYRGSIPRPMIDKMKTLSRYKFAICYENTMDDTGNFTEKIFDSLCSRTVPIYWGAENISKYVDADTFIDRRKFKNDEDLASFITKMTEKEYKKYLAAGDRYLKSERYDQFLPKNFAANIIKKLNITKPGTR